MYILPYPRRGWYRCKANNGRHVLVHWPWILSHPNDYSLNREDFHRKRTRYLLLSDDNRCGRNCATWLKFNWKFKSLPFHSSSFCYSSFHDSSFHHLIQCQRRYIRNSSEVFLISWVTLINFSTLQFNIQGDESWDPREHWNFWDSETAFQYVMGYGYTLYKVQSDFSTVPRLDVEDFTEARYPFAYSDAQTRNDWSSPFQPFPNSVGRASLSNF